MKRLAVVLAALLAFPAVAGWQKVASGWTKISASPVAAPTTGLTAGRVVLSNGATSITDDAGLIYSTTTNSLDVADGRVQAANLTATALATPAGITVTPVLSQIGAITVVAGSALADGDALSVGDGVGVVPIEFDAAPGDGTTGGAVAIIFDGTETATAIRDAVKVILDAAGRDWTTSNQGADGIGIVRATPGATGGAITEAVTNGGFTVTDWTDPTHATTVTYQLVACLADGSCTQAGVDSTTAQATATLNTTNYLSLSWSAVPGAATYKVYRKVAPTSPATTGVVYTGTALTVDDTGLAGSGATAPTSNGTGVVTGGRVLAGDGAAGIPGFAFAAEPGTGFDLASGPMLEMYISGSRKVYLDGTGLHMGVPIEFGGYPAYLSANAAGVVTVGLSAAYGSKDGSLQLTTLLPATNGGGDVGSTTLGWKRVYVDYTNTATVGAVEINKAAGRVNIDTAGTSVVVTNSLVTANSHVLAVVSTADANAYVKNVVPAAGSFTITLGAAAAAQTSVDFFVLSSD